MKNKLKILKEAVKKKKKKCPKTEAVEMVPDIELAARTLAAVMQLPPNQKEAFTYLKLLVKDLAKSPAVLKRALTKVKSIKGSEAGKLKAKIAKK